MPEPQRARAFDRAERKFDVMQELGTDLMLVCSNVSPAALGGIDRAADGFPRARRARREARPARRLRGAGLGPARQRPSRRLGDRAARRSSECRPDPRLLPHAGAQDRRRLDPRDSRRQDLHRAARRRAADRHGPALLEPALPQHAGPGRPAGRRLHARGRGDRLSTATCRSRSSTTSSAAARRKAIAVDGRRSLVYLDRPGGARASPRIAHRGAGDARPHRRRGRRVRRVRRRRGGARRARPRCSARSAFARPAGTSPRRSTLYRQGDINLVINTEREGFAHSSYLVHGTSAYAIGLKVEDAAATVARAKALGAELFEQPVGPGRTRHPGDPRRRRRPDLFPRRQSRRWRRSGTSSSCRSADADAPSTPG